MKKKHWRRPALRIDMRSYPDVWSGGRGGREVFIVDHLLCEPQYSGTELLLNLPRFGIGILKRVMKNRRNRNVDIKNIGIFAERVGRGFFSI